MMRPTLFAAGASALLLLASLPVLSSASEPEPFLRTAPAGDLELAIDGDLVTVSYLPRANEEDLFPDQAAPGARVELRKSDFCAVGGDALGSLLSIAVDSPVSETVGLVNNGLGTLDNKCNTESGRVSAGEALTLSLGSLFDDDVAIAGGELDIEGKFGADLALTGTYRGSDVVLNGGEPFDLSGDASDNGADSGSSDNTAVVFAVDGAIDTLRVTPTSTDDRGTISLEGGGDFTNPDDNRTTLDLVRYESFEYALGCDETVQENAEQLGQNADTGVFSAELTRYSPEDGLCGLIGVDLSEEDGLLLRKTTTDAGGVDQIPALRLRLTWRVPLFDGERLRTVDEIRAEIGRQIDLVPGDDASAISDVEYCTQNNDNFDALKYPSVAEDPGYDPLHLDTAERADARLDGDVRIPWCLLTEAYTVVDGYLVQVQVYDGAGDPRFF